MEQTGATQQGHSGAVRLRSGQAGRGDGPDRRALLAEDDPDDAELTARALRQDGLITRIVVVSDRESYRQALVATPPPDVIVADYLMPGFHRDEALLLARRHCPHVPFIYLSGVLREDQAVDLLNRGAWDYVLKNRLVGLAPAVRRALGHAAEVAERARSDERRRRAEQSLKLSRERSRRLLARSQEIIAVLDPDGRITYASPSMRRLLKNGHGPLTGAALSPFVHPDDVQSVTAALQQTGLDPVGAATVTFRIVGQPAAWRTVEAIFSNRLQDPAVRGIVLNAKDITQREAAMEAQRRSAASLSNINRALLAVDAANATVLHAEEESALLRRACADIAGAAGYPLVWVALAGEEPDAPASLVAQAGDNADAMLLEESIEAVARIVKQAVTTPSVRVVPDVEALRPRPGWVRIALEAGLRAVAVMPIRDSTVAYGALGVHTRRREDLDEESVRVLAELAGNLGFGIGMLRVRHERDAHLSRLTRSFAATVQALAATSELRDPYTAGHQRRVALLSAAIGVDLGLDESTVEGIRTAAAMHDIGKIAVPAEILAKPATLTGPEFEIVKVHCQAGHDVVAGIDFPWPVADMILQHHERLDGSGYPQGLRGESIGLGARIIAVADTVEAMVSHRPYRPSLGVTAALAAIVDEQGVHFDAHAVESCCRLFHEHRVRLPDQRRSLVPPWGVAEP